MTHQEDYLQRTLKLYKTKTSHNFQFHCELTNSGIRKMYGLNISNEMECCIAYDEYEVICPGNLDETNYGFSIEVPEDVIMDPNNKYLHESDKLVIQFRYRNLFYAKEHICRSGIIAKEDEEQLSQDLLSLYKNGKLTDFEIFYKHRKKPNVHKAICGSRSKGIDDLSMFGVGVKGEPHHVDIVIQYMYSGILPNLSVDDILKITAIVEELDIPRLRISIQRALLESLNKNTAEKIRDGCIIYPNMHQLAAAAIDFLYPIETEEKRRGRR